MMYVVLGFPGIPPDKKASDPPETQDPKSSRYFRCNQNAPVTPLSTAVVESTHLEPNLADSAANAALNVDTFANLGFDFNLGGPIGNADISNSDVSSAADPFPAANINAPLFDPAMFEFDFSVLMADP
ncbi:hypothetical protein MSAN_01767000 [Mycena sanguinolenta]|uniref:Uncharacterized protein n=1 Tax=Mycena sanguinolenta TaxID=230812 RepID=A0A8H6XXI8_9AGAR|nr:hypothetical protein MSAN_01767000 [Mycena sanguinolenta]